MYKAIVITAQSACLLQFFVYRHSGGRRVSTTLSARALWINVSKIEHVRMQVAPTASSLRQCAQARELARRRDERREHDDRRDV